MRPVAFVEEYKDAVAAGHHASLLKQKRENIFRINVGGIELGHILQSKKAEKRLQRIVAACRKKRKKSEKIC